MSGFRDAAIVVLSEAGKALHVDEITKRAIAGGHIKTNAKNPRSVMWKSINDDIKKSAESKFARTAASTYKLRSTDSKTEYRDNKSPDQKKTKTMERDRLPRNKEKDEMHRQRLGAAGEYRVMSELLLREYNADKRTIDHGVDILAEKDGRQFYIQVKAATRKNNTYTTGIKKKSFSKKRNLPMYYVFVLRDADYRLDFVVLSSKKLSKMISTKKEHTASYTIHLSKKGDKMFLGRHDVTQYRNDWPF